MALTLIQFDRGFWQRRIEVPNANATACLQ
jgi:hypothetical protein